MKKEIIIDGVKLIKDILIMFFKVVTLNFVVLLLIKEKVPSSMLVLVIIGGMFWIFGSLCNNELKILREEK